MIYLPTNQFIIHYLSQTFLSPWLEQEVKELGFDIQESFIRVCGFSALSMIALN
jgi:hypothetical protein